MRAITASVGQLITTAGAKRVPTILGAILSFVGVVTAALQSRTSTMWLVIAALICFMIAIGWAYHDLRMDNERMQRELQAARAEPPAQRVLHEHTQTPEIPFAAEIAAQEYLREDARRAARSDAPQELAGGDFEPPGDLRDGRDA